MEWEYATLGWHVDVRGNTHAAWKVAGDGEGRPVPAPEWDATVATAGRDGWELVSATATERGETLFFKRRATP